MKLADLAQAPLPTRIVADAGVYGTVAVGWLGLIQPWLTALATLLAVTWTSIQIYYWFKNKKKKTEPKGFL